MNSLILRFLSLYSFLSQKIHEAWAVLFPVNYIKRIYRKTLNRRIDLQKPRDFNEKIEWLKIYSDTSMWTDLADKYKVREYVNNCGLDNILPKLYGTWERAEDIDFGQLPDKFVIKTNHGYKKTIIVQDKSRADLEAIRGRLKKWLKERYGLRSFEPHYWNIRRLIIAEEYLIDTSSSSLSTSLIDYKIFCINGEPEIVVVLADRGNMTDGLTQRGSEQGLRAGVYDIDWNIRNDVVSQNLFAHGESLIIPRPQTFSRMVEVCRLLSKPFPVVRVDLYQVNNQVYFGEMTFTPGGNRNYFTQEYFLELGSKIDLTSVKRRTRRFII